MQKPLPLIGSQFDSTYALMKKEWRQALPLLLVFGALQLIFTVGIRMMMPKPGVFTPTLILPFSIYELVLIGLSVLLLRRLMKSTTPVGAKPLSLGLTMVYLIVSGIISVVASGLAALLLILPGIWLAITLSFAGFEIIELGKSPIEALSSSYALVKGRWWATFGRVCCAMAVVFGVDIVLGIFVGIFSVTLFLAFGSSVGTGATSPMILCIDVFNAVVIIPVMLFMFSYQISLYRSLKETQNQTIDAAVSTNPVV